MSEIWMFCIMLSMEWKETQHKMVYIQEYIITILNLQNNVMMYKAKHDNYVTII